MILSFFFRDGLHGKVRTVSFRESYTRWCFCFLLLALSTVFLLSYIGDYRLEHENTVPLEKDVLIDSKPFWGFKYFECSPELFGG